MHRAWSHLSTSARLVRRYHPPSKQSLLQKQCADALSYHYGAARAGVLPLDSESIPSILRACAGGPCLKWGAAVHATVLKAGLESYASVTNSIMSFYTRCAMVDSSWNVFDHMMKRDSVSWNIMIHGSLSQGAHEEGLGLFAEGRAAGFEPNLSTLVLVLQACWRTGATREGLGIHGFVIKHGTSVHLPVQNALLSNYAKSRDMDSAHQLFDEINNRDVITWSVMVGGYAQCGEATAALQLFRDVRVQGGVDPDGLTFVSVLQACSCLEDVGLGRMVHACIIRRGFQYDVFVGNSLVDMYSKCLDVDSAYGTFREMSQRNIISWNSMLSGFVHNEQYLEALVLFDLMKAEGIATDEVTLVNLLQSCRSFGQAAWCKCIHGMVTRWCFESNVVIMNSVLDAYVKCGLVKLATKLFELMDNRNLISWSTMIMGYNYCSMPDEAIAIFREMMLTNIRPNSVTMLSVLQACSAFQEIKLSRSVHGIAVRNSLAKEVTVGTALLDMYAKCGEIDLSSKVFHELPEKTVISWSAMISAYGLNGRAREAIALLHEMKLENVEPNKVTMLSLLSACSHGGLVEEGLSYFKEMNDGYLFKPSAEHYSCMVDMLGRAGDLGCALEVIKKTPEGIEVGACAWGALLSACRNSGNSQLGEEALTHVMMLEKSKASGYLLASNMYAIDGSRADTARMRLMMKEKGVKVVAGCSSVHVDQRVYKFVCGDESHPYSKQICSTVNLLHLCMGPDGKDDFLAVYGG